MKIPTLLAALALNACVATPDLCGVPYTKAEDMAGVEHDCSHHDPARKGELYK